MSSASTIQSIASEHKRLVDALTKFDWLADGQRFNDENLSRLLNEEVAHKAASKKASDDAKRSYEAWCNTTTSKGFMKKAVHGAPDERRVLELRKAFERDQIRDAEQKQALERTMAAIAQSQEEAIALQNERDQKRELCEQLERLYESVFGDSTPDLPENEDGKQRLQSARWVVVELEDQLKMEKNSHECVQQASDAIAAVMAAMDQAEKKCGYLARESKTASQAYKERGAAIEEAQRQAEAVHDHLLNANRVQMLVTIVHVEIISIGDLSKNWFSSFKAHAESLELIKENIKRLARPVKLVQQQLSGSQERIDLKLLDIKRAEDQVEQRARELEDIRKQIIYRVTGGPATATRPVVTEENIEEPPPYGPGISQTSV